MCSSLRSVLESSKSHKLTTKDVTAIRSAVREWADDNLPETTLPTGQTAKRLTVKCGNNELVVNKAFFKVTLTKNISNPRLADTMELATRIDGWLPDAKLVRTEEGRHHNCDFRVYETVHGGTSIEVKVNLGSVMNSPTNTLRNNGAL